MLCSFFSLFFQIVRILWMFISLIQVLLKFCCRFVFSAMKWRDRLIHGFYFNVSHRELIQHLSNSNCWNRFQWINCYWSQWAMWIDQLKMCFWNWFSDWHWTLKWELTKIRCGLDQSVQPKSHQINHLVHRSVKLSHHEIRAWIQCATGSKENDKNKNENENTKFELRITF